MTTSCDAFNPNRPPQVRTLRTVSRQSFLDNMISTERRPVVQLVPMRQLVEVKDFRQDDWTGLADASERRKRQSRLTKRAQRKSVWLLFMKTDKDIDN